MQLHFLCSSFNFLQWQCITGNVWALSDSNSGLPWVMMLTAWVFLTPLIWWQPPFGDTGYPESLISSWLFRAVLACLRKGSGTLYFSLVGHFWKIITSAAQHCVTWELLTFSELRTHSSCPAQTVYGWVDRITWWVNDRSSETCHSGWQVIVEWLIGSPSRHGSSVEWLEMVGGSEIMMGFMICLLNSQ